MTDQMQLSHDRYEPPLKGISLAALDCLGMVCAVLDFQEL